jgi:hypothetical protein
MNEIRFNPPTPEVNQTGPENKEVKKISKILPSFKFGLKLIGAVIALLLIVFLAKYLYSLKNHYFGTTNTYSAVFLANGQVYFGKMTKNTDKEIVLKDVFYIQLNEKNPNDRSAVDLQSGFNLVRLGNELHGPTDELFINRSQVVFYEDLRENSKVVEVIKNYNK